MYFIQQKPLYSLEDQCGLNTRQEAMHGQVLLLSSDEWLESPGAWDLLLSLRAGTDQVAEASPGYPINVPPP